MINQLRMIFAEYLLGLAVKIAPSKTDDGYRLVWWVRSYLLDTIEDNLPSQEEVKNAINQMKGTPDHFKGISKAKSLGTIKEKK